MPPAKGAFRLTRLFRPSSPPSEDAHASSTMGLNASKPIGEGDKNFTAVKKQIGRRSSINLLKKLDTRAQTNTRSQEGLTICSSGGSEDSPVIITPVQTLESGSLHSTATSRSEATTVVCNKALSHSEESVDSIETDEKSPHRDDSTKAGAHSPDRTRAETPSAPPFLPPPPVLEEESPTKYGLNTLYSLEHETTTQVKRRTTTGPELFKASLANPHHAESY